MTLDEVKKQRKRLSLNLFLTALIISLPISLLFLFFDEIDSSLAFFLCNLVVSLDLITLIVVSGMIFDSGDGGIFKLSVIGLFKLLLLIVVLYGIITLFKKEPFALFAGITLPVGIAVFWGIRSSKE